MVGINKILIKGKFVDYTQLTAQNGYCFYDVDDEYRNYMTSITTPITDEVELERKYIEVVGNADELNEQYINENSVNFDDKYIIEEYNEDSN